MVLWLQLVVVAALLLPEAYNSAFEHKFKKMGAGMTPLKPNPEAGGETDDTPANEKPSDAEIQAALANIRKAHGEYERQKKSVEITLDKSNANTFTKGCNFENILKQFITDGGNIDVKLVKIERTYLVTAAITQEDIRVGKMLCSNLFVLHKDVQSHVYNLTRNLCFSAKHASEGIRCVADILYGCEFFGVMSYSFR